jgi:hypothetical protein
MARIGLPQLLVVLAVVIAIVGAARLSSDSPNSAGSRRSALLVSLVLMACGVLVWLLTVSQHV